MSASVGSSPMVSRGLVRSALLLGLLGVGAPAAAQEEAQAWMERCREWEGDRDRAVHCEVREYRLPASGALEVNARPNGGIRVEGWARNEILVQARVQARAPSEAEARELASRIEVEAADGRVRANGPDTRGRRSWSVSYRVFVPRRIDLDLESVNGGLAVSGVTGDMELSTTNGAISLREVAGEVRGETTNGALEVELTGGGWAGEGLDLETTNGAVTITMPEGYNARLEAATVNGGLTTDFPITVQGRIGRRVEAELGRGGAPIRVRTTNGAIRLRRG